MAPLVEPRSFQLCKTSGLQQSVVGVAPGDGKRVLVTVQNKGVDIYDFDAKRVGGWALNSEDAPIDSAPRLLLPAVWDPACRAYFALVQKQGKHAQLLCWPCSHPATSALDLLPGALVSGTPVGMFAAGDGDRQPRGEAESALQKGGGVLVVAADAALALYDSAGQLVQEVPPPHSKAQAVVCASSAAPDQWQLAAPISAAVVIVQRTDAASG